MKINSFSPVNHKVAVRHPCYSFVALAIATCFLLASANCIFANSERKNRKAMADSATPTEPTCSVENFGKVNDHYYRGAQPEAGQYEQLKALGIKTVIDLRDDPTDFAKGKAEAAGLRYLNMPLSDKKAPAEENVNKFLEYANDENNWPIFVHCAGGRHRTGAMTAVYRMTVDGWQIERAW
ncbi:MAG: tyrosine-protein phosphatase [Acidobacteria bacterium]|nr:tyrosine-protein phosphatase [Acidobacteriota bacterium]